MTAAEPFSFARKDWRPGGSMHAIVEAHRRRLAVTWEPVEAAADRAAHAWTVRCGDDLVAIACVADDVLFEWVAAPGVDSEQLAAAFRASCEHLRPRRFRFRSDDPTALAFALSGRDPADVTTCARYLVPRSALPSRPDATGAPPARRVPPAEVDALEAKGWVALVSELEIDL
jgi:hypothetical protein